MTTKVTAEQLSRARGCVLGLVLGDAVGAADPAVLAAGPLPATPAGQLACFTIEGIIRANVRHAHKGISHKPSVVWHAYTRWAAMQGIPGIKRWGGTNWPDGWLAQVPVLAVRRGSAPATVAALQAQKLGTMEEPAGSSTGAHGLTRCLPVGLLPWRQPSGPGGYAAQLAATTHSGDAVRAAALGATIVACLAKGQGVEEAIEQTRDNGFPLEAAVAAARSEPRQAAVLAQLAPDAQAMSALAGGIYVALSFPGPEEIRDGLQFAAASREGSHVGAVAGALLGTRHGFDALPVDWVSRLELAWVADVLARDLLTEFADWPSGGEYKTAPDPRWFGRYPGW